MSHHDSFSHYFLIFCFPLFLAVSYLSACLNDWLMKRERDKRSGK